MALSGSSSPHPAWHKHVIGLLDRGARSAQTLPGAAAAALEPTLRRAQAALQSISLNYRDGALQLSAARIHVETTHRLCRTLILDDVHGQYSLTSEQMSQLVQVRQVCLEALPLLTAALDDTRRRRRT